MGKLQEKYRKPSAVEKAMEYIRGKSNEWMIDEDKIAVIGFSAGGHLAAAISTLGRNKPNAAILGYPCIVEERCSRLCRRA